MFVDHDNTVYLYWGSGGGAHMAQLMPDLRAVVPGTVKDLTKQLPNFYEGPWLFERNGAYYLMYDVCDVTTAIAAHIYCA